MLAREKVELMWLIRQVVRDVIREELALTHQDIISHKEACERFDLSRRFMYDHAEEFGMMRCGNKHYYSIRKIQEAIAEGRIKSQKPCSARDADEEPEETEETGQSARTPAQESAKPMTS